MPVGVRDLVGTGPIEEQDVYRFLRIQILMYRIHAAIATSVTNTTPQSTMAAMNPLRMTL